MVGPGGPSPGVHRPKVVIMTAEIAVLAAGHYVHWGVIQVSVTNLAIIVSMVVVFVLALVVPFPHGDRDGSDRHRNRS